MNVEVFFTVLGYIAAVLGAWFAVTLPIAMLLGKSIRMADERQPHPAPESVEDAA